MPPVQPQAPQDQQPQTQPPQPVAQPQPVPAQVQPVAAPQATPGQPLLADKAEYLPKMVGIGKGGMAYLFPDRIQFVDKNNQPLAVIALNTITEANYASGVLRLKVGEQLHVISFFTLPYRFFGMIGVILSGAGKKTKAWVAQMQQLGVQMNKKLL